MALIQKSLECRAIFGYNRLHEHREEIEVFLCEFLDDNYTKGKNKSPSEVKRSYLLMEDFEKARQYGV